MDLIYLRSKVMMFSDFGEFAEAMELGGEDLILTQSFLYDGFMKDLGLACPVIFQDKYGLTEPDDVMVNEIIKEASAFSHSRIIAVGGGTVIDIGKLLALEPVEDIMEYYSKKKTPVKNCELVIVPTTCGTGSEVTNKAIIGVSSLGVKQGIDSDAICADQAVLIPELVRGLPLKVFMHSSIDAFVHAAESYLSPKSSAYTELFALDAIERIILGYQKIREQGEDYRKEIIEEFVLASNEAGIAFGNTGVGAVHAMAMVFGGEFHVPHGEANYEFLIAVLKKYLKIAPEGKISRLNKMLADRLGCSEEDAYEAFENLLDTLIRRKTLSEYGMKEEDFEAFADKVIASQQRLLVNNYVPLAKVDLVDILRELF